jgi:hypothetical protein
LSHARRFDVDLRPDARLRRVGQGRSSLSARSPPTRTSSTAGAARSGDCDALAASRRSSCRAWRGFRKARCFLLGSCCSGFLRLLVSVLVVRGPRSSRSIETITVQTLVSPPAGYSAWLGFFDSANRSTSSYITRRDSTDKHGWRNRNQASRRRMVALVDRAVGSGGLVRRRLSIVENDGRTAWAPSSR